MTQGEEWADDFSGSFAGVVVGRSVVALDQHARMNAAETAKTGAANDAHEHGFSLVVEGVSGGDFVERGVLRDELREEAVAQVACRFFKGQVILAGVGGGVGTAEMEFKVVMVREFADKM